MAKAKNKKSAAPVSLRYFMANPVNVLIIIVSVTVASLVIAANIPGLSFNEHSKFINCSGQMRRIELFDSDIQQVHHYAKVFIGFAGIVLVLAAGTVLYRNNYWKGLLVLGVILLLVYVLMRQIGQGLEGIACLDF